MKKKNLQKKTETKLLEKSKPPAKNAKKKVKTKPFANKLKNQWQKTKNKPRCKKKTCNKKLFARNKKQNTTKPQTKKKTCKKH